MGRGISSSPHPRAAFSLYGEARLRRCRQAENLSEDLPLGSRAGSVGDEVEMAERESKRELLGPVTLSVLDRLLDDEPKSKVEDPMTHSKSLAQLKIAIRRDLENLLNTRCTPEPMPESS